MQIKESLQSLGQHNFLLPLNKAAPQKTEGEGMGGNMTQMLRSVLAQNPNNNMKI